LLLVDISDLDILLLHIQIHLLLQQNLATQAVSFALKCLELLTQEFVLLLRLADGILHVGVVRAHELRNDLLIYFEGLGQVVIFGL
jgi:hypothetical protein